MEVTQRPNNGAIKSRYGTMGLQNQPFANVEKEADKAGLVCLSSTAPAMQRERSCRVQQK